MKKSLRWAFGGLALSLASPVVAWLTINHLVDVYHAADKPPIASAEDPGLHLFGWVRVIAWSAIIVSLLGAVMVYWGLRQSRREAGPSA